MCTHTHIHTHTCAHTHTHTCLQSAHLQMHADTHNAHTHVFAYSQHTLLHSRVHMCMCTLTTTHALAHKPVHTPVCAHSPTRSHVPTHNIDSRRHARMCHFCVLGGTRVVQVHVAPVPIMPHQRPPLYNNVQQYSDAPNLCLLRVRRGCRKNLHNLGTRSVLSPRAWCTISGSILPYSLPLSHTVGHA